MAQYECPKCANMSYETGEIRVTGSFLGKIFDVQGQKFTSVTCSNCRYTEFFRAESSMLGDIFDLFT
jgi:predicted nucleic-acid-binding Zn-ribbon protein